MTLALPPAAFGRPAPLPEASLSDGPSESDPDGNDILRAADGGAAAADRIDLSGIDARAALSGNQAFAFNSRGAGGIWILEEGANTVIRGRIDARQGFQFELLIEDGAVRGSAYSAAHFIL